MFRNMISTLLIWYNTLMLSPIVFSFHAFPFHTLDVSTTTHSTCLEDAAMPTSSPQPHFYLDQGCQNLLRHATCRNFFLLAGAGLGMPAVWHPWSSLMFLNLGNFKPCGLQFQNSMVSLAKVEKPWPVESLMLSGLQNVFADISLPTKR